MADIKIGFHYSRLYDLVPIPEFARLAEEMGLDSVWLPEGLVNEVPALDILMGMSGFIHHTRNITIGASVVLLPLRNPVVLAKEVSTLDLLSGGRVVLGIGAGGPPDSNPTSFQACGVSMRERGARTDEALEIMTKLWTGAPVSHQGRFYSFQDIVMEPRPAQRPHPPIWAGGAAEGMLRRAAHWCDGFVPVGVNPEEYGALWDRIQRYGETYQRDTTGMTKAVHLFYRVGNSREEARRAGEEVLNRRRGFDLTLADDDRYAFGTAGDCMRTVERFVDAGITHFIFNALVPDAEVMGQVDRLVEEIVPYFK